MRLAVSGMLLLLMASGCTKNQRGSTPGVPKPDDAARDAVGTLSRLVTSENFRALGFESVDEAKGATLQPPLQIRNVPLDALKAYKPGASVEQLLAEPVETFYPVAVGGNVRTGVTISKRPDGFAPSAFGAYDLARRLSRYRQGGDGPGEFVVRIPAMNFSFLGRNTGGGLVLVPVVADPALGWKEGETLPAARVFGQLAPLAERFGDAPI
jgi:hypothetical protein